VDAFLSWAVDDRSTLRLNINNLTNEKYITSLYEIGFYSAPATYKLSYSYGF
jgi:outer membrane receptor for ferric coprogen and ferric-rhodotorulic acid